MKNRCVPSTGKLTTAFCLSMAFIWIPEVMAASEKTEQPHRSQLITASENSSSQSRAAAFQKTSRMVRRKPSVINIRSKTYTFKIPADKMQNAIVFPLSLGGIGIQFDEHRSAQINDFVAGDANKDFDFRLFPELFLGFTPLDGLPINNDALEEIKQVQKSYLGEAPRLVKKIPTPKGASYLVMNDKESTLFMINNAHRDSIIMAIIQGMTEQEIIDCLVITAQ